MFTQDETEGKQASEFIGYHHTSTYNTSSCVPNIYTLFIQICDKAQTISRFKPKIRIGQNHPKTYVKLA